MIKARFRRRDGRYVYDVLRDHSGKEYSKTFRTKKEAEAFEIAERASRMRGVWVDPRLAATRVVDVADRWLRANGAKRPGSIARDRSILDNHIIPAIGHKAVGSVSRADVQRLVNEWTSSHAPASTVRKYAVLRALMSYAEDSEIIARSPCRRIRLPQSHLALPRSLTPTGSPSSRTPWARTVRWLTSEHSVCDGVKSPDCESIGWTSCGRPWWSTVRSLGVCTVK